MSTEINIKKRITILEESAILTKDVNSIDFVGAGVVASTIGDDVTITIPGGSGNTTYYLNESVTQSPYKEFSSIVTSAIEQVVPLTVAGGVTSVIAEYQTPSGIPGTTQIPGGLWQFFLHFNAGSAGQNWIIRPTVLKRDLGGIETLLFTPDPEIVTGMSTTTTMYVSDGVFPATTLLTTDRIVVRISMQNTTGVSQTVNFRTEGSQHYSVGLTTLNQIIPTGAVTSVTGTAPVVSSGGTTPAISIPQADALIDGYLSSSDWSVFNSKVGGSGTTNYLSKFTGTGTIGNSQTQDDGANIAVNGAILSAYKFAVYSTTPGENYNIYGNTTVNGAVGVAGVNQGVGASTNYGTSGTAQSSTALNIGVYGQATGASAENVGGKFSAILATANYSVQLQDGTEGIGKVLTSMTADGKAQWAALAAAAGIIYITNQTTGVVTYYTTLELASAGAVSGDTIYVNPGTYVVTTTATNGLAKNGVNWYFEPGAIVNKATIGDIFNDTTFTLPINVFGEGTFNKTGSSGTIFTGTTTLDLNFEHYSSTNSTTHCFVFNGYAKNVLIKVYTSTSTAGCVIVPSSASRLLVNFHTLKSTSSNVIGTGLNQVKMILNGNLIQSTTSVAVSSIWNFSDVVANVTNTIGVTYGYSLSNNNPTNLTINGNTTGIQASAGNIYMNGYCGNLNSTGSISFLGGQIGTISGCSAGYIKTGWTNDGGMIAISGGVVELDMPIATASDRMRFNLTGGKFVINGDYTENYYTRQKTINGATAEFVINGDFICTATVNNEAYNAFFTLTNGIFRINGRIKTSLTANNEPLILWQGGKIIIEDAKLIIGQTNVPPIVATAPGLVMKVLGSMQTNYNDGVNNIFASRKQLNRFTINTAGVAAQLTINLGAVISETNVATYNTKPLMAERMKNLINASYASSVVVATYTAGNDYFDLEALVASVSYVTGSESNFSLKKLVLNSYLITDLTNGLITQNTNVE